MLALQDDFIADPDYSALVLRKTFVDLNQPEGILNRAQTWLFGRPGVSWEAKHNRFVFDSGAVIQFGHCNGPKDHLKYRGGKYNIVLWDELTDFPEEQYTFLFSRQRRPIGSNLPLLTGAASNPGGPGHSWVRERLVRNSTKAADRRFVPASYVDNEHLDQVQYGRTLDNLLPVERARIKYGDWDVLDTQALFDLAWFTTIDELPREEGISVRAWDCAATPGGGDYSVGLRLHLIKNNIYIDDMKRGQWGPVELDNVIRETAKADGFNTYIMVEREPGSAGKRANQYLKASLADFMVLEESPSGDKYIRAQPAAKMAAQGRIRLVNGPFIKPFLAEVTAFTGKEGADDHDDIVDALSLGTNFLGRCTGFI